MYAVFISGGKQYRVREGYTLKLEKIEAPTGQFIEFDQVLMLGSAERVQVGAPLVKGSKVTAEIIEQGRHDKINIIKIKRRKHHRKHLGHRQWFTKVKITAIHA